MRQDPAVRRFRLLAAAVSVAGAFLGVAGCGESPGQAAAQDACRAYANTGRHQVATTLEGADAIRASAQADARRATAADSRWAALERDIADFYSLQSRLQQASADELDAYFAADGRVQADCKAAGEDIGPLKP